MNYGLQSLGPEAEPAPQRQREPEEGEDEQGQGAGHHRGRGAEEDRRDQRDRAGHRQRQEEKAGDREAVRVEDQFALLLIAEGEAVVSRGGDQQDRRYRRAEQGDEVDSLLEFGDLREVLLKRDREQEGEEHLHARQRHPQLLQQLAEVAVEAVAFALLAPGIAFG